MKAHNKEFIQYLSKGQFKLVAKNNQDCKYLTTGKIDDIQIYHGQIT